PVGCGTADAEESQLRAAVLVLDGEAGPPDQPDALIGEPRLPFVDIGAVDAADGAPSEQLQVPAGGGAVDLALLGQQVGQRGERLGRRWAELGGAGAGVLRDLVRAPPPRRSYAVPAPVVVFEGDAPGAQLLDAAQEGQGDLRKLVRLLVTRHGARVGVS